MDSSGNLSRAKNIVIRCSITLMIMMLVHTLRVMYDTISDSIIDYILNYFIPVMVLILLVNIDKLKSQVNYNFITIAEVLIALNLIICHPLRIEHSIEIDTLFYVSGFYLLFYFAVFQYVSRRDY